MNRTIYKKAKVKSYPAGMRLETKAAAKSEEKDKYLSWNLS